MTSELTRPKAWPSTGLRPRGAVVAASVAWAGVITGTIVWGRHLSYAQLHLGGLPPLFASVRHHPETLQLIPAVVVAAVLCVGLPWAATRLRWRPLLLVTWAACAVWTVTLNASEGYQALGQPLTGKYEYLVAVPRVGSIHSFLSHFVAELPTYPTHVKGHGPLALLAFWAMAKIGLPHPVEAAAFVIAIGTSATAAVALTIRVTAGEIAARRALPFLTVIPAALWIATSADALFLGIAAWGVALVALATTRARPASGALALLGGILLGATLYMTYGLLVLALLPVAVLVVGRRPTLLVPIVVGIGIVATAFSIAGFSYVAGFRATHAAWASGVGPGRSRLYFLVGDFADLAVGVGPVTAIALATLRERRLGLIIGSVVIAIFASDLSGFVRGEAERIWLPFMPWLVAATADLSLSRRQTQLLLAAQALTALVVQCLTHSLW